MNLQKQPRWKSKAYREFVATLPCCICGDSSEVHHIKGTGNFSGVGLKADDILTMPLCRKHHNQCHIFPNYKYEQYKWICKTVLQAVRDGVLK